MKSVYHRVLVHNHIVRFGVMTFFSIFSTLCNVFVVFHC